MYDKILISFDGSEHSIRALDTAVQIAKNFNGKITLIYVCEFEVPMPASATFTSPSMGLYGEDARARAGTSLIATPDLTNEPVPQALRAGMDECLQKVGANVLADGEKRVKAEGVTVEKLLKRGHAVEEIIKTAKEGKFDLIAMGSRGLSKIKELALGSVSEGVMRHSSCPVLIVK